jgi:hypothetical protein
VGTQSGGAGGGDGPQGGQVRLRLLDSENRLLAELCGFEQILYRSGTQVGLVDDCAGVKHHSKKVKEVLLLPAAKKRSE